jgi:hypothetical protein
VEEGRTWRRKGNEGILTIKKCLARYQLYDRRTFSVSVALKEETIQ